MSKAIEWVPTSVTRTQCENLTVFQSFRSYLAKKKSSSFLLNHSFWYFQFTFKNWFHIKFILSGRKLLKFPHCEKWSKRKKSFGILNAERNLKSKVTMLQNYEIVILTLISIFALKNPPTFWNQKQNNWFSKFLAYFFNSL